MISWTGCTFLLLLRLATTELYPQSSLVLLQFIQCNTTNNNKEYIFCWSCLMILLQ